MFTVSELVRGVVIVQEVRSGLGLARFNADNIFELGDISIIPLTGYTPGVRICSTKLTEEDYFQLQLGMKLLPVCVS